MKKVALITGANRGIGLETARQLGKKEMTVLVAARTIEKAETAVKELKDEGIDAHAVKLDVTNGEDIDSLVKHIEEQYGKLDVLVNNAGIIHGESFAENTTLNVGLDEMKTTFDTNFFAVVNLTQRLIPLMKKSEAGRIVNLSSVLASLAMHNDEQSPVYQSKSFAYNASKTALNQFTVHLAATLKNTNIKVNSAHPGWVKTELGGEAAPMSIKAGARTSVNLATLDDDGPTGGYFHLSKELPW